MPRLKLSFWKFLNITPLSFLEHFFISMGVFLFSHASLNLVIGSGLLHEFYLVEFAIGLTLLGIGSLLLYNKFTHLTSVLETGSEITATVTDVDTKLFGGIVAFEYEFSSQKHRSTTVVSPIRKLKGFQTGQTIVLCVNPDKPEQAFIRDLYQNTN